MILKVPLTGQVLLKCSLLLTTLSRLLSVRPRRTVIWRSCLPRKLYENQRIKVAQCMAPSEVTKVHNVVARSRRNHEARSGLRIDFAVCVEIIVTKRESLIESHFSMLHSNRYRNLAEPRFIHITSMNWGNFESDMSK